MLRATGFYGDPQPWAPDHPALAFLNTAKYPASLLFLLMTLCSVFIALPLLENARGRLARWLAVFGKVPFFYYVLHIPLIHVVAVLISLVRSPESTGWLVANHPDVPAGSTGWLHVEPSAVAPRDSDYRSSVVRPLPMVREKEGRIAQSLGELFVETLPNELLQPPGATEALGIRRRGRCCRSN